jgi:Amt family ammonium transporter
MIEQLFIQIEGIFIICAWTGVVTFIILKILSVFIDLRVSQEEEEEGLDISLHNEQGYNL